MMSVTLMIDLFVQDQKKLRMEPVAAAEKGGWRNSSP